MAQGAEQAAERRVRNPVDRLTGRLPRAWRITIDWVVTIVGAIAIVLAIKAWVVNPYRIPSSSMEPTLHCARPGTGCVARFSDRVLANRFIYHFKDPARGDVVVFETPAKARPQCGAGGTFVKRIIGLPGETWSMRNGFVFINGAQAGGAVHQAGPPRPRELPAAEDRGGLVLRDGRQPRPVVRLAPVGLAARGEPDRQGVRGLLAAEPHFVALAFRPGPTGPFSHAEPHRAHRAAAAAPRSARSSRRATPSACTSA